MSNSPARRTSAPDSLAERFWSIARARGGSGVDGDSVDPVKVVRHVLSILDALDRGEDGAPVSVRTISFLKLLRESEQRGEMSYAAPEQITGEVLDERSLVFSVGVLLFERLTGRHPFGAEGNHVRRVARIRKGEFGSGVNYFPTVPGGLRSILMRAMGPFPEERFGSLRELRGHLEQFVEQEDSNVVPLPGTTTSSSGGKKKASRRAPRSDSESTRVVDMSAQVRSELLAVAEKKRRATQETSGLIEATPRPKPEEARAQAPIEPVKLELEPRAARPEPVEGRPTGGGEIREASESDLLPHLPKPDYVPSLRPPVRKNMAPLVYIGVGAALASLAFFLLSGGASSGDEAGTTETAASESEPPGTADGDTPTPAATDDGDGDQKEEAQAKPEAEPVALPAVFDPEHAGVRAIEKGLVCLTDEQRRSIGFGVGILYDSTGRVKKVYFAGKTSALPYQQRKCMDEKLIGTAIRPAPDKSPLVQYHATIDDGDVSVSVRE